MLWDRSHALEGANIGDCSDKDNRLDWDAAEGHGSGSVHITGPLPLEAPYHSMGWRSENWRVRRGLGALWETFSVDPPPPLPSNVGRQTEREMSGWTARV